MAELYMVMVRAVNFDFAADGLCTVQWAIVKN